MKWVLITLFWVTSHLFPVTFAQSCTVIGQTYLEGSTQKRINGYIVTRDCWQWQEEKVCSTGQSLDHCTTLATTPGYTLESESCLSLNALDQCSHSERTFTFTKTVPNLLTDNTTSPFVSLINKPLV